MVWLLSVSVALASTLLSGPPGDPGAERVVAERVVVERVVRPMFVEPPRCRSLTPDSLVVEEDGRECRVTAVTDEAPPRVHALLIDNSLTMRPFMQRLRKALARYVEAVPADEPIVVATFADNLVLRSGPTTNREEVLRVLGSIDLGYRTALRDALYWTTRVLEPRGERKVVVLFTDTFDNASLGAQSDETFLQLAWSDPDLTLFTVHLESGRTQIPNAAALLERLTRESGGEYFRIRGGGSLGRTYDAIRSRLDSELFVTYEPLPFGAGPLDEADRSSHRWRQVDVRVREPTRCAVRLPATTRLAGTLPPPPGPSVITEPSPENRVQPAALADVCPVGRRQCWSVTGELRFGGDSRLWLLTPPTYLAGRTLDVTAGRGAFYDEKTLSESGRFLAAERGEAVRESRDFRVETPPLAQIEKQNTLVDVLERWMRRGGAGPASFVHGQTWLEIREPLARAMYHGRNDYRAFADARTDRLNGARKERLLAEWLGDVPARDLALGLEARIADRLLSLPEGERRTELERLDAFWARLRAWFPPPTAVRVVAPLVPLYDPERDVIGFQRVILPRVTPSGGPVDDLPEFPLGARLLNRLLADRGLRSTLTDSVEVSRTECRPVYLSSSEAPGESLEKGAGGLPPYGAFEHTIHLATDRGEASLIGYAERQSASGSRLALRCMKLESGRSSSPAFEGIRSFLNESGLACNSGFEAIPIDGSPPRHGHPPSFAPRGQLGYSSIRPPRPRSMPPAKGLP
jgi:hypothetical protein